MAAQASRRRLAAPVKARMYWRRAACLNLGLRAWFCLAQLAPEAVTRPSPRMGPKKL